MAGNDKTRKECSRSGYPRRSCKLADNDKISFNKERRMALRCYSLSLYIIGNKNRETCLNRQNLRLIMSALRQAFFNAQNLEKSRDSVSPNQLLQTYIK